MKIFSTLSLMVAFGTICACSQGSNNSNTENTAGDDQEEQHQVSGSDEIATDNTLAGEDISTQASEAVSSTMNVDSSTGLSLGLALTMSEDGGDDSQNEERECVVGEGQTVVSLSRERSAEKTFTRNDISRTMSMSKSVSIERTWTKAGESIACNEAGTHIGISPSDFEGVTLNSEFEKNFSMSIVKTKGEETKSKNRSGSASGKRTVEWLSVNIADGIVMTQKQISLDINNSYTRLDKDGENKSVSFSLKTAEDSPLLVEIKRKEGSRDWIERTIVSGSTTAENADGGKIILTYSNALFNYEGECEPVSGTISGEIFVAGSDTPAKTFTADLAAGTKEITFSNDTTVDLELSGCEMSKPGKKTIKKVAKKLQSKIAQLKRKQLARQQEQSAQ